MVKRAGGALLLSIRLEHGSGRPVSTQLHVGLRELILSGSIAPGQRLPASRTLARDLAVSRTTVIEAFDRLTAEGLIESRVGAGTYVTRALEAPRPMAAAAEPGPKAHAPRLSRATERSLELFGLRQRLPAIPRAFTTALPAFDAFPMAQWARLSAKHWRRSRDDVMGYGEPFGHTLLRRAIASHLRANRGIVCDAQQIFIVSGAQQAFSLTASLLLNPGDVVWFENPGAIGARNSLIAAGAELLPVAVDAQGLRVEEGLAKCPRFALAFVTPSHQQPLGVVMSLERRLALLHAAEQAGAWVIEDDYDGEFRHDGRPLAALKALDADGRVVYVGSFSKVVFPALRLGFALVPPALREAFRAARFLVDRGSPAVVQQALADLLASGRLERLLRRSGQALRQRRAALLAGLVRHCGAALEVEGAAAGMHVTAWLRDVAPGDLPALVAAAERVDLGIYPITPHYASPPCRAGLLLGYAALAPRDLAEAARRLGGVLGARVSSRTAGGALRHNARSGGVGR